MTSKNSTTTFDYHCGLKVEFLTSESPPDGLKGALFVMGRDENGKYVVLDKVEAPVEMVTLNEGQVQGTEFKLEVTKDEKHKRIKGIDYCGYLIVLYSGDGTVLEKEFSSSFLEDHDKVFSLEVGDRFNKQLEKV